MEFEKSSGAAADIATQSALMEIAIGNSQELALNKKEQTIDLEKENVFAPTRSYRFFANERVVTNANGVTKVFIGWSNIPRTLFMRNKNTTSLSQEMPQQNGNNNVFSKARVVTEIDGTRKIYIDNCQKARTLFVKSNSWNNNTNTTTSTTASAESEPLQQQRRQRSCWQSASRPPLLCATQRAS